MARTTRGSWVGCYARRLGGYAAAEDADFKLIELAAKLTLPKSTIYKLAQEGEIPGDKVGRHWRFHKETIDRWLKATLKGARPDE